VTRMGGRMRPEYAKDLDIVATDDPGVSIDLDKPEDFERVRAILEK